MGDPTCHNCRWNGREYLCLVKFDKRYRGEKQIKDLEDWEVRKVRCPVQSLRECEIYILESREILGR